MATPDTIRYAAVYVGDRLLGEHPRAKDASAYAEKVQQVALHLSKGGARKGGKHDLRDERTGTRISISQQSGRCYACVTPIATESRLPFGMLDRMSKTLGSMPDTECSAEVRKQVEFTNNPANDKLGAVQKEVEEVKDIVMENIERVLDRGERLTDLVQKTDDLQTEAQAFQRKAKDARKKACWEAYKTKLMLACVCIAVILIILMIFCKPNFSDCT